jgi:rod shape-determining protein MreB and related proteins
VRPDIAPPTLFRLAGYIPLCDHGFALPAYLGGGNRPSIAVAEIEGDHGAPIARFERWESGIVDLHTDITVSVHDPWQDVFLWKDRVFCGKPAHIYEVSRPVHAELQQARPLAFLDLALAAGADVAPHAADHAASFLIDRFGPNRGSDCFQAIVLRPGVLLELHRAMRVQRLELPTFARYFKLRQAGKREFTIELAKGTGALLSTEALQRLTEGIERFGRTIGASLQTVVMEDPQRSSQSQDSVDVGEPVGTAHAGAAQPVARSPWPGSGPQFAIDIGTQNTRIIELSKGIVLTEPSVIAIEMVNGVRMLRAAGEAALDIAKKDLGVELVWTMRDGVITDFDTAEVMLRHFMEKTVKRRFYQLKPQVIVTVPLGSTAVERRALRDAVVDAGAGRVFLIEEPLAAAIGAGMPVERPIGSLVVDIGSGRTEVAVVSISGIAFSTAVRVGGDRMDEAISSYLQRHYGVLIDYMTAERIKKQVGSAKLPESAEGGPSEGMTVKIRGRDLSTDAPKEIDIAQREIVEALAECVNTIVEGVRIALEHTAPELSADIADRGIVLTGGGALLPGLDIVLRETTGLEVTIAEDPLTCVARGLERVMEDPTFRSILIEA